MADPADRLAHAGLGRLVLNVLLSFSQFEREMISVVRSLEDAGYRQLEAICRRTESFEVQTASPRDGTAACAYHIGVACTCSENASFRHPGCREVASMTGNGRALQIPPVSIQLL